MPLPLLPLGLELPLVPGPIGLPEPDPAVPDPILPLPGSVELLPEPIDAPIPELSLEPEVVELGSPDPMPFVPFASLASFGGRSLPQPATTEPSAKSVNATCSRIIFDFS